jgi:hypothetical protein
MRTTASNCRCPPVQFGRRPANLQRSDSGHA